MYNKRSLSKDTKASKAPKSISKPKDIILDPMGQWKYPGQNTRIPGNDITMQGVNYPVLGVGSNGQEQMMYPGQDYKFQGADYVDEYPQMKKGGGLKSKKYSRDLEATNYLFHKSPLFKKPKSKKKKIFHPKAKHYQKGGQTDEWGRPTDSPWYGFNPDTNKFTTSDPWGRKPGNEWYGFNQNTHTWEKGKKASEQKENEEVQRKRYESLYGPIEEKVLGALGTDEDFYNLPTGTYNTIQQIYGDFGLKRNIPPVDPVLKEMQEKLLSLPEADIQKLLNTRWTGIAGLANLATELPDNVSYKELYRYYNHINKLKKQGYTLQEGGALPKAQIGGKPATSLLYSPYEQGMFSNSLHPEGSADPSFILGVERSNLFPTWGYNNDVRSSLSGQVQFPYAMNQAPGVKGRWTTEYSPNAGERPVQFTTTGQLEGGYNPSQGFNASMMAWPHIWGSNVDVSRWRNAERYYPGAFRAGIGPQLGGSYMTKAMTTSGDNDIATVSGQTVSKTGLGYGGRGYLEYTPTDWLKLRLDAQGMFDPLTKKVAEGTQEGSAAPTEQVKWKFSPGVQLSATVPIKALTSNKKKASEEKIKIDAANADANAKDIMVEAPVTTGPGIDWDYRQKQQSSGTPVGHLPGYEPETGRQLTEAELMQRYSQGPTLEYGGTSEGMYMDLTDDEIEQYKQGGYVVEELPQAQFGRGKGKIRTRKVKSDKSESASDSFTKADEQPTPEFGMQEVMTANCPEGYVWDPQTQACIPFQNVPEATVYGDPESAKEQRNLFIKLAEAKRAFKNTFNEEGYGGKKLDLPDKASIAGLKDNIQQYKKNLELEKARTEKARRALALLKKNDSKTWGDKKVKDVLNGPEAIEALRDMYAKGEITRENFMNYYNNFGQATDVNVQEGKGAGSNYSAKEAQEEWGKSEHWNDFMDKVHTAAMLIPTIPAMGLLGPNAISGVNAAFKFAPLGNAFNGLGRYLTLGNVLAPQFAYDAVKENGDFHTAYKQAVAGNYGDAAFDASIGLLGVTPYYGKIKRGVQGLNAVRKAEQVAVPFNSKYSLLYGNQGKGLLVGNQNLKDAVPAFEGFTNPLNKVLGFNGRGQIKLMKQSTSPALNAAAETGNSSTGVLKVGNSANMLGEGNSMNRFSQGLLGTQPVLNTANAIKDLNPFTKTFTTDLLGAESRIGEPVDKSILGRFFGKPKATTPAAVETITPAEEVVNPFIQPVNKPQRVITAEKLNYSENPTRDTVPTSLDKTKTNEVLRAEQKQAHEEALDWSKQWVYDNKKFESYKKNAENYKQQINDLQTEMTSSNNAKEDAFYDWLGKNHPEVSFSDWNSVKPYHNEFMSGKASNVSKEAQTILDKQVKLKKEIEQISNKQIKEIEDVYDPVWLDKVKDIIGQDVELNAWTLEDAVQKMANHESRVVYPYKDDPSLEGLSQDMIDNILNDARDYRGQNWARLNKSVTVGSEPWKVSINGIEDSRFDYFEEPAKIAETVIHENVHTSQKPFDWIDEISKYSPELEYRTNKTDTPLSKMISDAMVTADKNDVDSIWPGTVSELHAELGPARKQVYDGLLKEGIDAKTAMQMLKYPNEQMIDLLIKEGRLNRFFKSTTTEETKREIIKILPMIIGAAGVAGVAGAGQSDSKKQSTEKMKRGGQINKNSVFKGNPSKLQKFTR